MPPPATTALGALLRHITVTANSASFQPMNVNFGLFPVLPEPEGLTRGEVKEWKVQRTPRMSLRALSDLSGWLGKSAE